MGNKKLIKDNILVNFTKIFLLFFIIGVIGLVEKSNAQTVCSQVLNEAQDQFDNGHLYGIPAKLKDCLDRGFTKQERIQAYKLLTITYLLIDDPISAENSYLNLLRLDPEHQLNPEIDPIEIIYLDRKFTTTPIITLHLAKIGVNFSNATIIHNNGIDNTSITVEEYDPGFGFEFGAGADLNINENFNLGMELILSRNSYSYFNILPGNLNINLTERIDQGILPLFIKFTMPQPKIHPYVYGGYSLNFLLRSKINVERNDIIISPQDENPTEQSVTGPDINITDMRKFTNSALIFGAGLRYRLNYEYISFDIRATAGLSNLRKPIILNDASEELSEVVFRYGALADDFRLQNISISIGYVKPLYKPRKKTKRTIIDKIKALF